MEISILQTPTFGKQKKKLKKNIVKKLDDAIKKVVKDPKLGTQKKGALKGVWVFKFKVSTQQYLLAYEWDAKSRTFIAIGVHENFYKNLEK